MNRQQLAEFFANGAKLPHDFKVLITAEECKIVAEALRGEATRESLDADRYRWWRNCPTDRQYEILEMAGEHPEMLDHHIDKGMCGL